MREELKLAWRHFSKARNHQNHHQFYQLNFGTYFLLLTCLQFVWKQYMLFCLFLNIIIFMDFRCTTIIYASQLKIFMQQIIEDWRKKWQKKESLHVDMRSRLKPAFFEEF